MKRIFLLFCTAGMVAGCSLIQVNPSRAVFFYDLRTPAAVPPPVSGGKTDGYAEVAPFTGSNTFEKRMMFFKNDGEIRFDEYNRWADCPAYMLRDRFFLALNGGKSSVGEPRYLIEGTLFLLQCNMDRSQAEVMLEIVVRDYRTRAVLLRRLWTENAAMDKVAALDFGNASGRALNKIIAELAVAMNSLRQ